MLINLRRIIKLINISHRNSRYDKCDFILVYEVINVLPKLYLGNSLLL